MSRQPSSILSVIIPVHNAEKYLSECLDSILSSNYKFLEVICIDDGSTDSSGTILDNYADEDSRVVVIHRENKGVSSARNRGIGQATGEYITFVDSDDQINSEMYYQMINFMQTKSLDCVVCNYLYHPFSGPARKIVGEFPDKEILERENIKEKIIKPLLGFGEGETDILSSVWNKIFSASVIRDNKLKFNECRTHGEDWQFCIEYFSVARTVGFCIEAFYQYLRRDKSSLISSYRDNYFKIELEDRLHFKNLFPDLDWDSKKKERELKKKVIDATLYYRIHARAIGKMQEIMECADKYEIFAHPENKFESKLKIYIHNSDINKFTKLLYAKTNLSLIKSKIKIFLKILLQR